MNRRERPVQGGPPPAGDLLAFPAQELSPEAAVFRAHGRERSAGWFSSDLSGRFDLPADRGTAYVADGIAAAIRERLGVAALGNRVSPADADEMAVTELAGLRGRYADVSCSAAAVFRVTAELTSMTPYQVPQAWAKAFDDARFAGVRYAPRFTPGEVSAWAVFGAAGAQSIGRVLTVRSGREACRRAGITVLPPPPSAAEAVTVKVAENS